MNLTDQLINALYSGSDTESDRQARDSLRCLLSGPASLTAEERVRIEQALKLPTLEDLDIDPSVTHFVD